MKSFFSQSDLKILKRLCINAIANYAKYHVEWCSFSTNSLNIYALVYNGLTKNSNLYIIKSYNAIYISLVQKLDIIFEKTCKSSKVLLIK